MYSHFLNYIIQLDLTHSFSSGKYFERGKNGTGSQKPHPTFFLSAGGHHWRIRVLAADFTSKLNSEHYRSQL
jgi:hypothetical protein